MEKPRYNAAIVPCQDYDAANVHAALVEALEAIGGLDWVKSGMTVGIKPNLASAKAPEYAVCTHPVMVAELARLLIEKGAKVIIGESPGGLYNVPQLTGIYRASGMERAAEELRFEQAAELRDELVKAGIPMPKNVITPEACAEALYALLAQ